MARAIGGWKEFSMARKANGQGHTYKVGNSYRTVIHRDAYVVTAMATTPQESKRKAKEKLLTLPNLSPTDEAPANPKMKLAEFLLDWLENNHQHNIAHTTYKRYRFQKRLDSLPLGTPEVRRYIELGNPNSIIRGCLEKLDKGGGFELSEPLPLHFKPYFRYLPAIA